MSLVLSCGVVFLTMYTPRHNTKGALLTEKWLGFKLYLETAERYRMQNLTPEIFEKYLPYAMIFGVEKKWAKILRRCICRHHGGTAGRRM